MKLANVCFTNGIAGHDAVAVGLLADKKDCSVATRLAVDQFIAMFYNILQCLDHYIKHLTLDARVFAGRIKISLGHGENGFGALLGEITLIHQNQILRHHGAVQVINKIHASERLDYKIVVH